MKNVSAMYIKALYDSPVVRSTISGMITMQDGSTCQIEDNDIIPRSLSINNKCVNGNSFELGAVYQGALAVQLKIDLDRYKVKGAKIEFKEHRFISEVLTEDVDLGTYYVSEPSRTKSLLSIKALDRMDSFDTELQDDIVGTPYQLLQMASEVCGVPLEQGEDYFRGLPNGTELFSAYQDTTGTYRDLLAYIGMLTGTFAVIVADKLRMSVYSNKDNITVTESNRSNTVIEDYETYYSGVVARFIAEEKYAPYEYIDSESIGGLVMDLGDIPLVRGLPEKKTKILQNIFGMLKNIRYTPAAFSLLTSDAALELGDRVKLNDSTATYITSLSYVYHGSESIKGVGDNPRVKTEDKTSKRLSDMEAEIQTKNITVHSYVNASSYTLNTQEKQIISINFVAVSDTRPIFIATIPFAMNLDGYIVLKYYMDGVLMENETVRQYVERGEHAITISNNFAIEENRSLTLSVKACTEYFESDRRQQAAKIIALDRFASGSSYMVEPIDTTPPQAIIGTNTIRAVLYEQGLAGTVAWDGTLNLTDEVGRVMIGGLNARSFSDVLNLATQIPKGAVIVENVSRAEIGGLAVRELTGDVNVKTIQAKTIEMRRLRIND